MPRGPRPAWLSPLAAGEVVAAFAFGGMVFFAGVVAPMVFSRLPADQAARA